MLFVHYENYVQYHLYCVGDDYCEVSIFALQMQYA